MNINIDKQTFDNIVINLSKRSCQMYFDINKSMSYHIMNLTGKNFINHIFNNSIFDNDINSNHDAVIIWGNGLSNGNIMSLQSIIKNKTPVILFAEDGFVRSYDTWVNVNTDRKYTQSCSLILDTLGYYFDATKPTLIENMLNDDRLIITEQEKLYARNLINKIVTNKISKYNHQPLSLNNINIGNNKNKVLVIDQSYGDFSIKKGMADDNTFKTMLETAIKENPNSDIIVKTHPDSLVDNSVRKGYYQGIRQENNIYPLTLPINPYTILEKVSKVYVCSSQFGLEALFMDKEVHTFGIPFYSNWGLTIDHQKCERRKTKRTIEELFYIFYILYTFWYDPITNKQTNIESVINYIINLRNELSK